MRLIKMIRVLNRIDKKLEVMIDAMLESNDLMRKLTTQLEIISLPPDMVLWSKFQKENYDDPYYEGEK